ncbi:MAG: hypothetical protein BAJALOKI2v1_950011 [Promethearchaeota archaeon]|nr:MAG: hypothetical protein BAJALOKI2v1_950011 [Candidatus Lokiarchaeota archaeon]
MIICSNCGSINSESEGKFCRKCGALLPVSKSPPKIKVPFGKKDKEKRKEDSKKENNKQAELQKENEQQKVVSSNSSSKEKRSSSNLNLQEIPTDDDIFFTSHEASVEQKGSEGKTKEVNIGTFDDMGEEKKEDFLQEITPTPFRGSIIQEKDVFGTQKARQKLEEKKKQEENLRQVRNVPEAEPPQAKKPKKKNEQKSLYERRHKLEKDMREVLQFISKKFQITEPQEKQISQKKNTNKKEGEGESEIAPSSMNEILKQLLRIDLMIEASAIIKEDGTILASALSERISDSLFATIGQNLSMIGRDIIEGLNAGALRSISVRGTTGVIDLAPIDKSEPSIKDMLIVIFSNPKVKNGVINIAVNVVRRQIKKYLGIEK